MSITYETHSVVQRFPSKLEHGGMSETEEQEGQQSETERDQQTESTRDAFRFITPGRLDASEGGRKMGQTYPRTRRRLSRKRGQVTTTKIPNAKTEKPSIPMPTAAYCKFFALSDSISSL